MTRLDFVRNYERECYYFLKELFEEVHWKSFDAFYEPYDFLCYNDEIVFNVDAKRIINNEVVVTPRQLKCALFVFKRKNKFVLCGLRTMIKRFKIDVSIRSGRKINKYNIDDFKFQTANDYAHSTNTSFLSGSKGSLEQTTNSEGTANRATKVKAGEETRCNSSGGTPTDLQIITGQKNGEVKVKAKKDYGKSLEEPTQKRTK